MTLVKVFDDVMTRLCLLVASSVSILMAVTGSSEDRRNPKLIQKSPVVYTKEALEAKLEGVVVLEGTITTDGSVSDIKVVKGLGLGLDEKAVENLNTWRFIPAVRNGEPAAVNVIFEVRFKLL
jgi:TonB family protein